MTLARSEWVKLVDEWRRSGQSARQFAPSAGVTDAALRYWAGRLPVEDGSVSRRGSGALAAGSTRPAGEAPALARVVRRNEVQPLEGSGRVVVMVGKASIFVEPGFDAAHLREVVRALRDAG